MQLISKLLWEDKASQLLNIMIKIRSVLEDTGKEQLTTGEQVLSFPPLLEPKKVTIRSPILKFKLIGFEFELKIKADIMFLEKKCCSLQ